MKIPGWLRCLGVIISFLVSAFDIGSDWHAASVFLMFHPAWSITILYCVITAIATLFFFTECFLARVKCVEETDDVRTRIRDYFSIGLLIIEDLGCAIIFHLTFYSSNCVLFREVYIETRAFYPALLSSIISCAWKAVICFKYCFNTCKDSKDWLVRKVLRAVLAVVIMCLAIGALQYSQQSACSRPACLNMNYKRDVCSSYDFPGNAADFTTVTSTTVESVFEASSPYDDEDMTPSPESV